MRSSSLEPVVHVPFDLPSSDDVGALVGYYHETTNHYNVVGFADQVSGGRLAGISQIGAIVRKGENLPASDTPSLVGIREGRSLTFVVGDQTCGVEFYDLDRQFYSRHVGLLDYEEMRRHRVVIAGVGSVGSLVSLE